MTVHVRLFAILRERAGRDSVELDLPEPATVADALAALRDYPGLDELERLGVRMAVNREYAGLGDRLFPSDELALIPPVAGGASTALSSDPLSLDALLARVADPAAGAIVTFQGLPRDIPALDYEAYLEMAAQQIDRIVAECVTKHGLCRAAAEHRTGTVPAGEASVIVAASAPHRAEAFAGAREILDRIKAEAPIWKVEINADGSASRVPGTTPA